MDQFKKGGKLQNSNIFATNRLFAKNPLFKKRKKKAPGIYNPNAKYKFETGGLSTPKDLDPEHMKKYLEALRFQENDAKKGYKNGKWYPHHSVEGGADTIAYGHKLTPNDAYLRKGITEDQAISLQEQDVLKNQALAKKQVDKKYGAGTFDNLPQDSQMLLVDYQYNLGTLSGFPSFVKATVEGNKDKMLAEHKRYGAGSPLTRRNEWTAGVINNMQFPEPFDPMQVTIPPANIPDATNFVQPVTFTGPSEVQLPPHAKGGIIELDLDDADIDHYVKGGYVVEDISIPSLNKFPDGGTLYTYPGNPNASYKKIGDQWYISSKGTGNKFVPIQDPGGKRAAELNKNAVVLPGQPAPVEQPRGVQGAPAPSKLPGQAQMELSSARKTAPTVQNQQKIKTLETQVAKDKKFQEKLEKEALAEQEQIDAAKRGTSDNTVVNLPTLPAKVEPFQPIDLEKEKAAKERELQQLMTSGDAIAVLGDDYHNQGDLSLRQMLEKRLQENPTQFYKDLEQNKYDRFLKQEQQAYNNLPWYDKGINELGNFMADPVHTGATWLGGNRTLVNQSGGVRDEEDPNYLNYLKATGYEDDYANKIFNWVNTGSNGADLAVNKRRGNSVDAALDLGSILFKSKVASQGLKATSAEMTDLLKKQIGNVPNLTGNNLLKTYSAYEAGTKYAPNAIDDFTNFYNTGNFSDLKGGIYDLAKIGAATIPYTKFNDANAYPIINDVKTIFGAGDSGVKGTEGAPDYQLKTIEKVNKVVDRTSNAAKPLLFSTMLRLGKLKKEGGVIESELSKEEINDLIAQGYIIEQV